MVDEMALAKMWQKSCVVIQDYILERLCALLIFVKYSLISHTLSDRNGDAIASYQKAISLDPGHTTAMTSLARVYRSTGENEKAEELFERWVDYITLWPFTKLNETFSAYVLTLSVVFKSCNNVR